MVAGRARSLFVTQAKVKNRLPAHADPRILRDELIVLTGHYARRDYPGLPLRVTALVEVDGVERKMLSSPTPPPPLVVTGMGAKAVGVITILAGSVQLKECHRLGSDWD